MSIKQTKQSKQRNTKQNKEQQKNREKNYKKNNTNKEKITRIKTKQHKQKNTKQINKKSKNKAKFNKQNTDLTIELYETEYIIKMFSFWLTTNLLYQLVHVIFNKQSAFLWVVNVFPFSRNCSFIRMKQILCRASLEKWKNLAWSFNFTFRCIDDILSPNNLQLGEYISYWTWNKRHHS